MTESHAFSGSAHPNYHLKSEVQCICNVLFLFQPIAQQYKSKAVQKAIKVTTKKAS